MYLAQLSDASLNVLISQFPKETGAHLFLMVAEKERLRLHRVLQRLREAEIPFFGGLFPQLIAEGQNQEQGMVAKPMLLAQEPQLVKHLSRQPSFSITMPNEEMDNRPALVLVDGLSSGIGGFMDQLYQQLGSSLRYLGGGAGSLSLEQAPCLICEEGIVEDAALFVLLQGQGRLGVRHGWEPIEGPFVATRSQGNVIEELNWRPAFEVYKEVVEAHSKQEINAQNFFSIAKGYPFGMTREGAEYIVRDPISVNEEQALVCVGEVRENTVLSILNGSPETLISAAAEAAAHCLSPELSAQSDVLAFDCISRVLFLEEGFAREVAEVEQQLQAQFPKLGLEGALTLGEISSDGKGVLEFFNKTMVIGLLDGARPGEE